MATTELEDNRLSLASITDAEEGYTQEKDEEKDEDIHTASGPSEHNIPLDSAQAQSKEPGTETPPDPITDWDGPHDPGNPHNWSMASRVYHAVVPGLFGFAVTFGTSVYTPAIPDVMLHFHTSRTIALVGLTVYTLGLGFGPVISAPLSENYGRKIVYMVSGPIFMLFTLGAGFSKSLASLMICRFLAGMTGSPALAVGAGTNADVWLPKHRAAVTSIFLMAPFAGPSLGPIVGGFAAQYKGFRWTQWCMIFISIAVYLSAVPSKETYKPIILKRRAKKLGRAPASTDVGSVKKAKNTILQNTLRPMHILVTEPVVFFLSLYTAFTFAILFLFFAAFPFVFSSPPYHFTTSQVGLAFVGIGVGVLLGGISNLLIDSQIYQVQHRKAIAEGHAHAQPEHRLYNAMVGSLGIPVGLFWFAWTADSGCHWAIPIAAAIPFAWGNLCLFTSAALYMVDVYGPLNGASAIAANGIFRYTLGAVFPLFTVQMYQALGTGWATSLLGFLSLLMLPIPWVLYKWGPAIRKRSRYPVLM